MGRLNGRNYAFSLLNSIPAFIASSSVALTNFTRPTQISAHESDRCQDSQVLQKWSMALLPDHRLFASAMSCCRVIRLVFPTQLLLLILPNQCLFQLLQPYQRHMLIVQENDRTHLLHCFRLQHRQTHNPEMDCRSLLVSCFFISSLITD